MNKDVNCFSEIMIVYTDNPDYCSRVYYSGTRTEFQEIRAGLPVLAEKIFASLPVYRAEFQFPSRWQAAFTVHKAPCSHYDLLIDLCRKDVELPDRILCLAGSGEQFHGQRDRSWTAVEGNIHLTVFLAPKQPIPQFGTGFSILSAVSLVETIDRIPGLEGRAGIKWVNDILIDGAKVAGFLAFTQSREKTVEKVVLGIGLNVETVPQVAGDFFVPRAAALSNFISSLAECHQALVLQHLLERLEKNYGRLLKGGYLKLLEIYKKRSLIIGRKVVVMSDPVHGKEKEIARGRVKDIGQNLELFLENKNEPVTNGRLIIISE
jgi:BirA family biotin operon repressor/biotin-[acetyl-CoA-carboxylase] ligase